MFLNLIYVYLNRLLLALLLSFVCDLYELFTLLGQVSYLSSQPHDFLILEGCLASQTDDFISDQSFLINLYNLTYVVLLLEVSEQPI